MIDMPATDISLKFSLSLSISATKADLSIYCVIILIYNIIRVNFFLLMYLKFK